MKSLNSPLHEDKLKEEFEKFFSGCSLEKITLQKKNYREMLKNDRKWLQQKEVKASIPAYSKNHNLKRPAKQPFQSITKKVFPDISQRGSFEGLIRKSTKIAEASEEDKLSEKRIRGKPLVARSRPS